MTPPTSVRSDENLFRSILDALDDAVIVIDRSMHVHMLNQQARQMFAAPENARHRLLIEVVHHESISSLAAESIERNEPVRRELMLPGANRVVLMASVAPTEGDNLFCLILRDETRQFETEQVRRDFVANASHELRTPLTIINGYLENLLEDGVLDAPDMARQMLTTMKKHGDRIASIVEDMLTISKLESATSPLRRKHFSLRSCVHEVLDRLAPKIDRSRVRVHTAIPGDAHLCGDRFYWDQIFFNLIDNAIKYNTTGPLEVAIDYSVAEDGCHRIEIRDDGIGISRRDLPYIFNRFYRSEYQPHEAVKGTGLGLSIVKRAIEAHGGEIQLSSTPGVETTFTIRVPDNTPTDGEPAPSAELPG